jgi:hypothetical protein
MRIAESSSLPAHQRTRTLKRECLKSEEVVDHLDVIEVYAL